jgi:sugar/nucleoside kinase (ribokinase family)
MKHSIEVIGFGALNCDRIYEVEHLTLPGQEVGVISCAHQPGGSAANTIVGLARLGVQTGFIGTVGDDREGRVLLDDLRREGVDLRGIKISQGDTGTALIFVDSRGERGIYILPSVNDTFMATNEAYAKQAALLHVSSFMDTDQLKMQIAYLQRLKKLPKISFSPGNIYSKLGMHELKPLIEQSFAVFLNREEAIALSESSSVEDVSKLIDAGAQIVAVTLGDEGAYIATSGENIYVPPYKSRMADTTGAGDAFAAGFLYGQLTGKNLRKSGLYGNFMASRSIAQTGGRKGLLRSLRELKA